MRTHKDASAIAAKLQDWQAGRGPLKLRLKNALVKLILNGELVDGDRMPPERRLATALAVSRTTVVATYDLLRDEGFLRTRPASGSVIHFADAGKTVQKHRIREIRRTYRLEPESSSSDVVDFAVADMMLVPEFENYVRDFTPYLHRDSYGAGGITDLREAIATYYTGRGLPTAADEILITSGAQQAISLALNVLLQRGDPVAVQNPTFFVALDALRMAGARLHALQTTSSAKAMREALVHRATRLIYVIATNHNPTGYTMSAHERETLGGIADDLGIPIIEDTVLDDLTYDGNTPRPLTAFCRTATTLTVGSLSKVFWSGLRLGWVRAPRSTIAQMTRLKTITDLGNNIISQSIAMNVFDDFDAIRSYRRMELQQKLQHTLGLLQAHLPTWTYTVPQGGLCLWIATPSTDVRPFVHLARRFGVNIIAGSTMSIEDSETNRLRLVFSGPMEATAEGIRRLAHAWSAFIERGLATVAGDDSVVV